MDSEKQKTSYYLELDTVSAEIGISGVVSSCTNSSVRSLPSKKQGHAHQIDEENVTIEYFRGRSFSIIVRQK